MHEIGIENGLKPLSWEKPHLQMEGVALSDLTAGNYPPGGDDSWAENLEAAIVAWNGSPPAPPLPPDFADKPALPNDAPED